MNLSRETLNEFDIYRDITAARARAEATKEGQKAYKHTKNWLMSHRSQTEDTALDTALDDALRAEAQYLDEWRRGKHRSPHSLGVGVRALIKPAENGHDRTIGEFTAEMERSGELSVVEVEVPAADEPVIGLILPAGGFAVGKAWENGVDHDSITFYTRAKTFYRDEVTPQFGFHRSVSSSRVLGISDSGGALWHNHG